VLPEQVPRGVAVAQASALGGLLLGLERGDGELLRATMRDQIAEPRRLALYPGYEQARRAALAAGAFGVAVSGAGPTLVALGPEGAEGELGAAVVEAYRRAGFAARLRLAAVDGQGARLE
jgi:homoserine kinase